MSEYSIEDMIRLLRGPLKRASNLEATKNDVEMVKASYSSSSYSDECKRNMTDIQDVKKVERWLNQSILKDLII